MEMFCCQRISHLTTLTYCDRKSRLIVGSNRNVLYFSHDEQAVNDSPENDVFVVEEITFSAGDKKLTSVCVFSTVCHRKQTGLNGINVKVLLRIRFDLNYLSNYLHHV